MVWKMSNILKPSRGEIWFAKLDPTVGHEQAKTRPCLIISTNKFNYGKSNIVVIVPLTSKNKNLSWHVKINPPEGGIKIPSNVICQQPRTISKKRLIGGPLGSITQNTLSKIEARIKILLDL